MTVKTDELVALNKIYKIEFKCCLYYTTLSYYLTIYNMILLTASFFITVVAGNSLFANLISYLQVKVCSTLMQQDLLIMSVNNRLEL